MAFQSNLNIVGLNYGLNKYWQKLISTRKNNKYYKKMCFNIMKAVFGQLRKKSILNTTVRIFGKNEKAVVLLVST